MSFSIIAGVSTFGSLCGYSLRGMFPNRAWWFVALVLMMVFLLVWGLVSLCFHFQNHRGYVAKVNGKSVKIIVGDLFAQDGLKVIPFNDRFDVRVDDVIISHGSLNGKMIDKYFHDKDQLIAVIQNAKCSASALRSNKRGTFPLGRVIQIKDFLMLAATHFNEHNIAYLGIGEYEQMLFNMWSELRRVYAGRKISVPLVGSGITDIIGVSCKDFTNLLSCMLCTLNRSGFQPIGGITIVLTKNVIRQINMNKIKEQF